MRVAFRGPGRGPATVRVRARVESNNGDILQPSFMLGKDIRRGDLMELRPSYRCSAYGIYTVYPTRKQLSLKVRRLIDYLVQAFTEVPWCS